MTFPKKKTEDIHVKMFVYAPKWVARLIREKSKQEGMTLSNFMWARIVEAIRAREKTGGGFLD